MLWFLTDWHRVMQRERERERERPSVAWRCTYILAAATRRRRRWHVGDHTASLPPLLGSIPPSSLWTDRSRPPTVYAPSLATTDRSPYIFYRCLLLIFSGSRGRAPSSLDEVSRRFAATNTAGTENLHSTAFLDVWFLRIEARDEN